MKISIKTGILLTSTAVILSVFAFKAANNCSISGNVTDKGTKDAVLSAAVVISQNGKQILGTVTDLNGDFCFTKIADGSYNISASYVGYNVFKAGNIIVKDGKSPGLKIELEPSIKELKSVEIISHKVPLTITESDSRSIASSPGKSVAVEQMIATPGVIVTGSKYAGKNSGYPAGKGAGSNNYSYSPSAHYMRAYDLAPAPPSNGYDLEEEPKPREKPNLHEGDNSEDYDRIIENEFQRPTDRALSTFSIDVDVASYGMMRKKIEQNQMPPKESVRLEELINYFTYDYADPADAKPFSVLTETGQCPWNLNHSLLHFGIQGRRMDKSKLPPSNLVFLLDVSGSMMTADKLPLVKQSLHLLVNELSQQDKIAMVVYAGNSGLVLPSTPCSQKEKIIEALDKLEAGGSTAGAAGIHLAYQVAKENFLASGNNRVILCTDGDFNVGVSSDADLTALIEQKREEGIFLSVLGFGMGNYKDSKMEKLADKGNGNYAYIDNIGEAKKNLVTQMGGTLLTIAKDVKIQVEFNPAKVKAYRLLGYENRTLADKDFNDDKKDAGEIGAGSSVTALYEIITDANDPSLKEISNTDPLKYQKTDVKGQIQNSDELVNLKIRYKEPKENTSKLLEFPVPDREKMLAETSNNFRFAASVASFGMLLRESKFKGNFTYEKVKDLAAKAQGKDMEGYRSEFIQLVGKASQLQVTGNR